MAVLPGSAGKGRAKDGVDRAEKSLAIEGLMPADGIVAAAHAGLRHVPTAALE
jgi:hypothetical protein